MTHLIFDWSAVGNMAIGALLLYAGKLAWQKYGSKDARVTPEGCGLKQEECRKKMLAEWFAFKLDNKNQVDAYNDRMRRGDDNFIHLNSRMDRANILTGALITIQMAMCNSMPNIDCEDLTKLLIKQGIEPETIGIKNGDGYR